MLNKLLDEPYWDEILMNLPDGRDMTKDEKKKAIVQKAFWFSIDVIKLMSGERPLYNYDSCIKEVELFIKKDGYRLIKESIANYVATRISFKEVDALKIARKTDVNYSGEKASIVSFLKETQNLQELFEVFGLYFMMEKESYAK